MTKIITRLSNGDSVDLSKLTVDELYELHFDGEDYIAKEILKLPPFSEDRTQVSIEAY